MSTELATTSSDQTDDRQQVQLLHDKRQVIQEQIGRRIVGQKEVIDHLLITLFARGCPPARRGRREWAGRGGCPGGRPAIPLRSARR